MDRVFNQGTVTGLDDDKLLKRFVVERDEVAFAALVARHGPMVLGVCRRILHDEHDVEDAFQATFLVLVSRAKAIRDGDLLGHWIYGVAHRVAVRARANAARRYVHEQNLTAARAGVEPPSRDGERRELRAVLDDELARLPEPLRAPLVLCHLEGLTHDEAARRLRWPVGTVRSRLARARDKLRRRLSRPRADGRRRNPDRRGRLPVSYLASCSTRRSGYPWDSPHDRRRRPPWPRPRLPPSPKGFSTP